MLRFLTHFKYRLLLGLGTAVLIVDQWTKSLVHNSFQLGETRELIPPVLALTYVRNRGAAFSLLDGAPPAFRDPFFFIVPIVALSIILYIFRRLRDDQKYTAVALTLVAAGAIGNLLDRVRYHFVVDFIDLHWKSVYHWPRFNVADSCIVVGVSFLFLQSLVKPKG